jgi:DNA-binding response OmpR family regulator
MSKKTILIVEDEQLLLDVLSKKLRREGFRTITASDGKEGFEKIKKEKPDMVLLDMLLPGMDGFEILTKMKEECLDSPVIIISNSGQPVDLEKAFKLGAYDFLVKSNFEPEEVIEKLNHFFAIEESANCKLNQKFVLVVEDDKFLRDLCVKKLISDGYCVEIAIEGEEAYDKIKCKKPSLVLLDIIMPGMSGFDVLKKVRSDDDKEVASTPIVIFSNLGQESDLQRARELGANDFFVKANLDIKNLSLVIKEYLR